MLKSEEQRRKKKLAITPQFDTLPPEILQLEREKILRETKLLEQQLADLRKSIFPKQLTLK